MPLGGVHHIGILVSDLSQAETFATKVRVRFVAVPGRPETDEPLAVAGMRSFFSLPETSGGLACQLIEET
jgi:catechol 2,3-dioxygenase-like lactoylglutathione lyase family enzyme